MEGECMVQWPFGIQLSVEQKLINEALDCLDSLDSYLQFEEWEMDQIEAQEEADEDDDDDEDGSMELWDCPYVVVYPVVINMNQVMLWI